MTESKVPLTSSRSQSFLAGLGFGYLNTVVVVVVGLWLTPFLLRHLGQTDYGVWLLGTQLLLYLGLLDLGVVALLPREVAYATGRAGGYHNAVDLPDLVGRTIRITLWQTPIVGLVALAFWLLVPDEWNGLARPLAMVGAAFVLLFPLRVFQALLQGLQDLGFVGIVQMSTWLLGTSVTVVLLASGWNLSSLAAGWIAAQTSSAAIYAWRLRSHFAATLPRRLPRLPPDALRAQMAKGLSVSVSQIAQVLLSGTDVLIVGRVLGPFAVVPYVCTGKLVALLANQPAMLMQMAEPALSELRVGGTPRKAFAASSALSQAVLLGSGAITVVVLAVNEGFVSWWVGGERYGGLLLTALMLANMLLRHLNVTTSYTLFCFGYERWLAKIGVMDGIVTVLASLALVHTLGPLGALLGSIAGVLLVSLPANLGALAREDGVSIGDVLKPLAPWGWRCALLAGAASGLATAWAPASFWTLAATTAVVSGTYLLVMYPLVSQPPLGKYLQPRLAAWTSRLLRPIRPLSGASVG